MSLFSSILNDVENALGVDLDGDGVVGTKRRAPTAPMPRPAEQRVQQFQQNNGRQPHHRALFIGINYIGQRGELGGCINDVKTMMMLLEKLHFPLNDMRVLTEDQSIHGWKDMPTKAAIIDGLKWLVQGALAGDTLFLHYSGHGTSVPDQTGDEEDGNDEALVPLDYATKGIIVDDDIFNLVVKPLADSVRLTVVMDCCHSGTLMDLPFTFQANQENLAVKKSMQSRQKKKKARRQQSAGRGTDMAGPDVIMFSGCKDDQTSADVSNVSTFDVPPTDPRDPGAAGGACTNALASILYKHPSLSWTHLLQGMREDLERRGFTQIPQISSTKPVDLEAIFTLWGDYDGNE